MANWSESEADYKTQCPYCHFRLVANLTIIKKQVGPVVNWAGFSRALHVYVYMHVYS